MKTYTNNVGDNELIYLIRQKEEGAFELLREKYYPMMIKLVAEACRYSNNLYSQKDDLLQEATIMLYKATESYQDNLGSRFSTYAYMLIKRRVDYLSLKNYKIRTRENNYSDSMVQEMVAGYNAISYQTNPRTILNNELENEQLLKAYSKLAPEEKLLMKCKLKNMTYQQMADKFDLNKKQIEYKLKKIKLKIIKMYEE